MRLVDLIDHLIETFDTEPAFKYFHLDAQTIVLEDYLEIRPYRLNRLMTLVREGRLLIGPWYQLNDEFLVSGEATIRSLLLGHKIAAEFGAVMKIGYIPDQFGHISQMPQILTGFGIDNAILGRGYQIRDDRRRAEFLWRAPDGSIVVAILMPLWYNNAQRFPEYDADAAIVYIQQIGKDLAPLCHSSHLLLMNGVDHLEAQGGVGAVIEKVGDYLPDIDLLHSTLPAFIDGVKTDMEGVIPEVVSGELRDDDGGVILAGTLSTRTYLKTANYEAETLVERYVEPLATIAYVTSNLQSDAPTETGHVGGVSSATYDRDYLIYLWKLLMENHPHDSICGCSIDQVHREMMIRFDQVGQIGEEIVHRAIKSIIDQIDANGMAERAVPVLVFNPLAWSRSGVVGVQIDFSLGPPSREGRSIATDLATTPDIQAIQLTDPAGRSIPFSVIRTELTSRQVLSPTELPMVQNVRRYLISFHAEDVPPLGYTVYTASPALDDDRHDSSSIIVGDRSLENGLVRVSCWQDGTISLRDLETGECYEPLLLVEDGGDTGDEYRYKKPQSDALIYTGLRDVRIVLDSADLEAATYRICGILHLPERISDDRLSRSQDLVTCWITHRVTLTAGSKRVDVETEIINRVKDHRFRLFFTTMIATDCSDAGAPFDVVRRPILLPEEWQDASTSRPMQGFVDLVEGKDGRGFALLTRGLSEYEVYDDRERTLALTLLRCVGYLSGSGDTPTTIPTPDAQCIGSYRFSYAIFPHRGDWYQAGIHREAAGYTAPLKAFAGDGQYQRKGSLPKNFSLLRIAPDDLIVTALKIAEHDEAVGVRFFNIGADPVIGMIDFFRRPRSIYYTNLHEEHQIELYLGVDGTLTMPVPAKKIVTLKIYF
jgi:alpha-mannosidase